MDRSTGLDLAGLIPLPIVHEYGHLLSAWLYHVETTGTIQLLGFSDGRPGIGVTIDYTTAPHKYAVLMVLLSGFLITSLTGALVYHFSNLEWLKSIGYVWVIASFTVASYDFSDIAALLGFTNGIFIRLASFFITGVLLWRFWVD